MSREETDAGHGRATHRYRFAEKFTTPIRTGEKTVTFRYDDERDVEPGDEIRAVTADGHHFGWLRVKDVQSGPAAHAYDWMLLVGGKHGARNNDDLLERLNTYYDDEIDRETIVRGIHFESLGVTDDGE